MFFFLNLFWKHHLTIYQRPVLFLNNETASPNSSLCCLLFTFENREHMSSRTLLMLCVLKLYNNKQKIFLFYQRINGSTKDVINTWSTKKQNGMDTIGTYMANRKPLSIYCNTSFFLFATGTQHEISSNMFAHRCFNVIFQDDFWTFLCLKNWCNSLWTSP